MIPIQRPVQEPPALADARDVRLSALALHIAVHGTFDHDTIDGYQVVREPLFSAQHHKCCYCEKAVEESDQAVEHYRPKGVYWWLAWTWENLLFVCEQCNRHKGSGFPLLGGRPLVAQTAPPGQERPAILDPASTLGGDDTTWHIVFRKAGPRWIPAPRCGSLGGAATIRHCKLDRPDLLDLYTKHACGLESAVVAIRKAIRRGDPADIQTTWVDETRRWLSVSAPFAALSRDIFDHHFPPRVRQRHGLTLEIRP